MLIDFIICGMIIFWLFILLQLIIRLIMGNSLSDILKEIDKWYEQ